MNSEQCITLAFGNMLCRMLKDYQCFHKKCSCHLYGECILGGYGNPHKDQVVSSEWEVTSLIGCTKERDAIQQRVSTWLRKKR